MKAAVVNDFSCPPRYGNAAEPVTDRPGQLVLDVLAVAVSQRVRSQADGSHYTSSGSLPLVPGVDGVGRDDEGNLRYFIPVGGDGALAERCLTDAERSFLLPAGADPVAVAAAMNPAMSSWLALRCRADLQAGQKVLVLGATGASGRLAIEIARHLGAGAVVAVGRGRERMETLFAQSADQLVVLDEDPKLVARQLASAGSNADIVLDYLWGEPTAQAMRAIIPARSDDDQPLKWIEIGSIAGRESTIPGAALRAVNLRLLGSGHGSVPEAEIARQLSELANVVVEQNLTVPTRTASLADVESEWSAPNPNGERFVLMPKPSASAKFDGAFGALTGTYPADYLARLDAEESQQ